MLSLAVVVPGPAPNDLNADWMPMSFFFFLRQKVEPGARRVDDWGAEQLMRMRAFWSGDWRDGAGLPARRRLCGRSGGGAAGVDCSQCRGL